MSMYIPMYVLICMVYTYIGRYIDTYVGITYVTIIMIDADVEV